MEAAASMRGASVVGVVFLLALLSVGAIAIDSLSPSIVSQTQMAATLAANDDVPPTPVKKSTVEEHVAVVGECAIGYDYAIKMTEKDSEGKTVPTIGATLNGGKTIVSQAEGNQCKGKTTEDRVGTRKCDASWACRVWFCKPADFPGLTEEEKKNPGCQRMPDSKVGEVVNPKKVVGAEVAKGLLAVNQDPKATEAQKKSAEQYTKSLAVDSNFQEGFNSAFVQTERDTKLAEELQEGLVEKSKADLQAKLEAYQKNDCSNPNRIAAFDVVGCEQLEKDLNAANQKAIEEQNRLAELQKQNKRLAELKSTLRPSTPPLPEQKPKPDDKKPPPGDPPPDRGPTIIYRDSFGDGENGALISACQGGNQQACQLLAGGGARPGYGAYPGQQQCGMQQQGGGLIGTILSVFMRNMNNNNNTNCVNGVPRPQCTMTASPQNITTSGQSVQLSWQSQNAFSASLSNAGNVPTQGSMTVNPQTTTTYSMFLQGYRDNYGQQVSGQCSVQVTVGAQNGTGTTPPGGAPKAQISCQPQTADIGMSIALSFACENSNTSAGTGFSTNNQMSGSATPTVVAPTLGSNNKVTYGLTCSKEGQTDTAECTVQINKTSIVLIANPKDVRSGKEANIGWITGGMEACTISSPTLPNFTAENADKTNVSGVAKTPPLTQNAKFVLSCTTKAGGTKTAETTVEVGN